MQQTQQAPQKRRCRRLWWVGGMHIRLILSMPQGRGQEDSYFNLSVALFLLLAKNTVLPMLLDVPTCFKLCNNL